MINYVQAIGAGNAIRLFIAPPPAAKSWRILRKTTNAFAGFDDPGAFVVLDGDAHVALDTTGLVNGVTYYYQEYWSDGASWLAGNQVTATPDTTYAEAGTDVLSLVRERLDLGLQAEVARGALKPVHGRIPTLNAPPTFEDTPWPVVTLHLESESPAERGLGEILLPGLAMASGLEDGEGWLARVSLLIVGWTLNPDERIALRQAIKRIVLANLAVFDDAGMLQIELQQSDAEELQGYPAPVYMVHSRLSCLAPVLVETTEPTVADVTVTILGL